MPAKTWYFADCDRPPPRQLGGLTSHESIMVMNPGQRPANLAFTLYWSGREPISDIRAVVEAERVRGFRLESLPGREGPVDIPPRTQYAIRIESDEDIVAVYGRVECAEPGVSLLGYTAYGN